MSKIEREHTCETCYYEEFDGSAYPCSRCIRNKPMDDMWQRQMSKSMNKRQKKKRANWWRKDLYKWCRRHPCESKEIICRIEELQKDQEYECIKSESEEE